MRIAQVANFIGPSSGGVKTTVAALGRGYVDAGCERLLICPGARDEVTETELGTVVRIKGVAVGDHYRLIVQPWRIVEALRRFRPDSVELADKINVLPLARWAHRHRVRTVLFNHEHLQAMVELRTGLTGLDLPFAMVNKALVRLADRIVVTSSFALEEFEQSALRVGTPVHTVPLGVDLAAFRPGPHEPSDTLRLVHFGRLSREKSPHLAVATAVELHRRGVPVRLDVYGDGPHRGELEELAAGAPVVFHGFVHDRARLARAVSAADVSLSVCPGETFGLAVLEALACGTPVVTADRGGASELVSAASGDRGAPHPAALADAVLRVRARPTLAVRAAARARAEQYPWSRTVDSMLAVHGAPPVERRWAPVVPLPVRRRRSA